MAQMIPNGGSNDKVVHNESLTTVSKIRDYFANGPLQEALAAIGSSPESFVNNLIDVQKDDVHLGRNVLQLFKEKCPNEYISMLTRGLRSSQFPVRRFTIEQIHDLIKENPSALASNLDAYSAIAKLVGDSDAAVFNKAVIIMSALDVDANPEILRRLKEPLKGNKTSMCNAFEVIVNLSIKYEEHLHRCADEGFIDLMVDELVQSKDILYQLNILELLKRLVVAPHCFSYFTEREIFESIADMVTAANEHPMRSLLLPGYLKFFGAVANLHPAGALRYYSSVVECLFETLLSGERSLLPVALDTLGYVGCTVEGKLCLAEMGAKLQSVVTKVSEYIRNSPTEIKVRALGCLEGLISVERDPRHSSSAAMDMRVNLMTREWFRCMNPHGSPMEALYENCKNPFPDIRLAAFGLLDAACQHGWGCEMVANTPGFIEYLLDRSVDHTKESREAKYAVIKRLSLSSAFDPTVTVKMTAYLEQGIFYSDTGLEVAMEEEN